MAVYARHAGTLGRRDAFRETVPTLDFLMDATDPNDTHVDGREFAILAQHGKELATNAGHALGLVALVAQTQARVLVDVTEVATGRRQALVGRARIVIVAGERLLLAPGLQIALVHGTRVVVVAGDVVRGMVTATIVAPLDGAEDAVVGAVAIEVTLGRVIVHLHLVDFSDLLHHLDFLGHVGRTAVARVRRVDGDAARHGHQRHQHQREELHEAVHRILRTNVWSRKHARASEQEQEQKPAQKQHQN